MTNRHKFFVGAAAALLLGAASAAHAANTFTAVSGNDWNTDANWSAGHVPADGEDVVVNGNVLLTNATAALASYTLNAGKTHTFNGWGTVLSAATINVSGTLTHTNNMATNAVAGVWIPNARVWIDCNSLTVTAGGKIDTTAMGYKGGTNAAGVIIPGCGPGGGGNASNGHGIGGSHGGFGGEWLTTSSGPTNDTYSAPSNPGSGAGPGGDTGRNGGGGGGVVTINALGAVTVNGSILANGGNGTGNWGGGGSGGSIYITCQTFSGTGVVSAAGGNTSNIGSGGGGGCIAIIYNLPAQAAISLPSVQITTLGGNNSSSFATVGGVGTLYFPDNQFLTRVTASDVVRLGGQWLDPSFTEWNLDSLTMANAWLRFLPVGFKLNVTNNFSMTGANNNTYRLETINGVIACGGDMTINKAALVMYTDTTPGPSVSCGGNLTVTNSSVVYLYCAPTNGVMTDYTSYVTVGGTMLVGSGAWVYPVAVNAFSPAAPLFSVTNLFVGAGAGFNASVQGYSGATNKNLAGYGPGKGAYQGGAGYGGRGGNTGGGMPYGSYTAPTIPGSGGGAGDNNANISARGGGVLRIKATDVVTINGSLLANGGAGTSNHGGGGSGGGIMIECRVFAGTNGVISSAGGYGASNTGGSGGGGRIAVLYSPADQSNAPLPRVQFSVAPANAYNGINCLGEPGTLYFPDSQFLSRTNIVSYSGQWMAPGDRLDLDSLVVSNVWLRFPNAGFYLNVTNSLTIFGTNALLNRLEISATTVTCGSLTLTNAASFYVFAGATNGTAPDYGALVSVSGDIVVGTNCWIVPVSHPTNGGSAKFTMNNLTLMPNGGFDASGRGFAGGTNGSSGFGPGRGISSSAKTDRAGGGGYGGQGSSVLAALGGSTYGSESLPLLPGSGGGAQLNSLTSVGGAGGGLVWVDAAGAVLVNGSINANGTSATGNSGAGSGGGVYIHCSTFNGTGAINANGGTSYVGGGGGRIAVVYTNLAAQALLAPSAQFSVASSAANGVRGDHGTLYFPDATFFPYEVIQGSYRMVIPTLTSGWSKNSLTVTNGEVRFPPGCALQITNSLTIGKGGILICTNNAVSCGGNLCVTNGGLMHVYAMPTNGAAPAYGMLVAVTGTMFVAAGSTNYVYSDPANGGSVFFDVGGLIVQSNGVIDANSKGFAAGSGRGTNGFGPGGGIGDFGSDRGGGGGYGGVGATSGSGANATGGVAYGSAYLPLLCGSGGGGKSNQVGSPGGGLIWMRVRGDAVVDGLLSANGGALSWTAGDGSGGGIFLDCDTFAGKGKLSADGGITANTSGANGGGGRIAVWVGVTDPRRSQYMAGDFSHALITSWTGAAVASYGDFIGAATATNGPYGSTSQKAAPGSIVFLTVKPVLGTLISVR